MKNKKLFTISIFFLGIILGFILCSLNIEKLPGALFSSNIERNLSKNSTSSTIRVFSVGDIMLNRGVQKMKEKSSEDWKYPFLKISGFLKRADVLFGNLEGPISNRGQKKGSKYSFRFETSTVEGLKYAGFDILSLANNHMLDYGAKALRDTLKYLNQAKIKLSGAGKRDQAFSLKTANINDTKIGFLSYTNLGPSGWRASSYGVGLSWINNQTIENVTDYIKNIKKQNKADILFVSLHAGEEYSKKPTQFQKTFAKASIEAGADVIINHHSHVIGPVRKYKDGWIAYSLGNFVFDQGFSEETMEGLLLEVKIQNKKIKEVLKHKVKMNSFFQPQLEK